MRELFYKAAGTIIDKCSNRDVLVLVDTDGDGICSGIQLKATLQRIVSKLTVVGYRPRGEYTLDVLMKFVNKYKPDVLVTSDLPIPDDVLIEIASRGDIDIIYLDHHKRTIPKKCIQNLYWYDVRAHGIAISCSGFVYRICREICGEDFKKYSIIAAIGAHLDRMLACDPDLIKDLDDYYPELVDNGLPTMQFSILTSIFYFLTYLENNILLEYGSLLVEDPLEFFKKIKKYFKGVVYSGFIENLTKTRLYYSSKNVIVYENPVRSSGIASFLRGLCRNKVLIVFSPYTPSIKDKVKWLLFRRDGMIKLSLRSDGTVDVGKFIAEFSRRFEGKGGGHPQAAGGIIPYYALNELIKELEKVASMGDQSQNSTSSEQASRRTLSS